MDLTGFQKEKSLGRKGRCRPLPNSQISIRPGEKLVQAQQAPSPFENSKGPRVWGRGQRFGNEKLDVCSKIGDAFSHDSEGNDLARTCLKNPFLGNLPKPVSCEPLKREWKPLLLFSNTSVEPVNTFNELPLRSSLIKNLQQDGKFTDLSQIQKWGIPGIRKQLNVVMIGGPKSGKTLAYLLPLLDYIQEPSYFEELPRGNGPHVVIVCSNSKTCESISHFCRKILGQRTSHVTPLTKILVVHGGTEKKLYVELTNGVDILIATPLCLERLLNYSVLTNFERLACLVIDEVHVLSENPFRHSVRVILEKAKDSEVVQKIFVGERWSVEVESLVQRHAKNYTLIITSFEDIAIYKKLVPRILFVERCQKFKYLMGILKMKWQLGNVIVVCENEKEAKEVKSCFQACRYPAVILCESFSTEEIEETITSWKSSTPCPLLITTDDILSEYNITNINTIIHFNIPEKSKTNFFLRYTAYCSFNDTNKRLTKDPDYRLNDIIFIDDHNHNQLPHILNFIKEMGGQIPENLASVSKEIWENHERKKVSKMPCDVLLSFGFCRNSKLCNQRHVFVGELDSFEGVPLRKWVRFSVLKVRDAACFFVNVTQTYDNKGRDSLPNHAAEITRKMKSFYKETENRRSLAEMCIGKKCAVEMENEGAFHRGKIVELNKFDKFGNPTEVKVRLMDRGDVMTCKAIQVLELPESLSKFPASAVEVRMAGIQPLDFDSTWSETSVDFVENIVKAPLEENQYWCGEVALALQDVLLLDRIMLKRTCAKVGVDICERDLHKEIIKEQLAIKNSKHLPTLRELCLQAGLIQHVLKGEENIEVRQPKPQWAFFDSKSLKVKLLAAEGLQTVFLQSLKHYKLFEDLEKELQQEGEKKEKEPLKNVNFSVGLHVLAKFEGKWNRGRLESEEDKRFKIFFVDYGDYWLIPKEDVLPIPNSLLIKLPLQAIECRLVGIKTQTDSTQEALKKLYDLCGNGYADLTVCVVKDDEESECTGGRKYAIQLTNEDGENVNKMLIECGLAEEEPLEKQYLESSPVEDDTEFVGFPDEIFDDEDGMLFLQEFACKVLNISVPMSTTPIENVKSTTQVPETRDAKQDLGESEQDKKFSKRKKRSKKPRDGISFALKENILTPKVVWNQNPQQIVIKVQLPDVTNYKLDCYPKNLLFAATSNEKLYVVDVRLFGAIIPQTTKIVVQAFVITISARKLVKLPWPRLHADDDKFWWIGWDAEGLEEENRWSKTVASAKEALDTGNVSVGIRDKKIAACTDSEFSDSECSYSDSE